MVIITALDANPVRALTSNDSALYKKELVMSTNTFMTYKPAKIQDGPGAGEVTYAFLHAYDKSCEFQVVFTVEFTLPDDIKLTGTFGAQIIKLAYESGASGMLRFEAIIHGDVFNGSYDANRRTGWLHTGRLKY